MRVGTLPACRDRRIQDLATPGEKLYANTLFYAVRSKPGFLAASAQILKRSSRSIACWQAVPPLHVRPFVRAVESGALDDAMKRLGKKITSDDRKRATAILDEMRKTRLGTETLADGLDVSVASVRKWKIAPLRRVLDILDQFGARLPETKADRAGTDADLSAPTASVSGIWRRNCLACGQAFSIDTPFIRRCPAHRGKG